VHRGKLVALAAKRHPHALVLTLLGELEGIALELLARLGHAIGLLLRVVLRALRALFVRRLVNVGSGEREHEQGSLGGEHVLQRALRNLRFGSRRLVLLCVRFLFVVAGGAALLGFARLRLLFGGFRRFFRRLFGLRLRAATGGEGACGKEEYEGAGE
jgi:hypothetical protein